MPAQPFDISVPQAVLTDLQARLAATRLDPHDTTDHWDAGTSPAFLAKLLEHWKTHFDWRAQEAALNRFAHFRSEIDGKAIHFIHEKGRGPRPLPLLLGHGFPDSFLRFTKLIPLLTHPPDPADAFDVVVPSAPGFAWSEPHSSWEIGDRWKSLMQDVLHYPKFGAHGGDLGSIVVDQLARDHASSLYGIHLTDVPITHGFQKPDDTSPDEDAYFARREKFMKTQGAYNLIQGSRPQTLADALNDSPIGLAAWWVHMFQQWSDCNGDVETRFTKDELLTQVMIFWATQTANSSFQFYVDLAHAGATRWMIEKAKGWLGSAKVPAGFAIFPQDIGRPPREYAERFFNVQRYTAMERGGHFAAAEEPKALAEELRAFFRPLRD